MSRIKLKGKMADDFVRAAMQATEPPVVGAAPCSAYLAAAKQMDWEQVVLNGGPPCFHVCNDGRFCGRAWRWEGHDEIHKFVSLPEMLAAVVENHDASKCSYCGVRPSRGGNRQGSALCQHCYEEG